MTQKTAAIDSSQKLLSRLQLDSKSMLAKLLAREDIVVEHSRSAHTALFIPDIRKLILPVWEDMSHDEYDLLIGHEVGHALESPRGPAIKSACQRLDHTKPNRAMSYLNVLEDARIERIIQDKYPGLRQNFRRGYDAFWKKDFFNVKGRDIDKLPFIDRLNIYFKMNDPVNYPISFSADEQEIIDQVRKLKTWEDVVRTAEAIYRMYENRARQKQPEKSVSDSSGNSSRENSSSGHDAAKDQSKNGPEKNLLSDTASDRGDDAAPYNAEDSSLASGNSQASDDQDGEMVEELSDGPGDGDESDSKDADGEDRSDEGPGDSGDVESAGAGQDDRQTQKEMGSEADANGSDSKKSLFDSPTDNKSNGKPENNKSKAKPGNSDDDGPEESLTVDSLSSAIEAEARKASKSGLGDLKIHYAEIGPVKNLDNHVFLFDNFWAYDNWHYESFEEKNLMTFDSEWSLAAYSMHVNGGTVPAFKSSKLRAEIASEVTAMVQEFNLRKAAEEYQKATVSKTGILNPTKLHAFSYSDDIFKRALNVKKGKSHGLILFIDWSGSMDAIIADVLRQTLILVEFCRQVQIPFEVYLFADNLRQTGKNDVYCSNPNKVYVPGGAKKTTELSVEDLIVNTEVSQTQAMFETSDKSKHILLQNVTLVQIFKSAMTNKEYQMAFNTITQWYYSYHPTAGRSYIGNDGTIFGTYKDYSDARKKGTTGCSKALRIVFRRPFFGLGGTPLNEAIALSSEIVKRFRLKNNCQIVNLVYLTDGASNSGDRLVFLDKSKGTISTNQLAADIGDVAVLRDTETKYQVTIDPSHVYDRADIVTRALLEITRYRTQCNVIGLYMLNSKHAESHIAKYHPDADGTKMESLKDSLISKRYLEVNNVGYTSYFLIPSDLLNRDIIAKSENIQEKVLSPKRSITKFLKESSNNRLSKVFLGRFMDLMGKESIKISK
jgi:hypothetical protein